MIGAECRYWTEAEREARDMAAALYDGGWRANDSAEIIDEYGCTREVAETVCEWLEYLEQKEKEEDSE